MILHEQLSIASAAAAKTKKGDWYKNTTMSARWDKVKLQLYLFDSVTNLSSSYTPWSLWGPFYFLISTYNWVYVHCGAMQQKDGKLTQSARSIPLPSLWLNPTGREESKGFYFLPMTASSYSLSFCLLQITKSPDKPAHHSYTGGGREMATYFPTI